MFQQLHLQSPFVLVVPLLVSVVAPCDFERVNVVLVVDQHYVNLIYTDTDPYQNQILILQILDDQLRKPPLDRILQDGVLLVIIVTRQ